jgi:hypothetical protein
VAHREGAGPRDRERTGRHGASERSGAGRGDRLEGPSPMLRRRPPRRGRSPSTDRERAPNRGTSIARSTLPSPNDLAPAAARTTRPRHPARSRAVRRRPAGRWQGAGRAQGSTRVRSRRFQGAAPRDREPTERQGASEKSGAGRGTGLEGPEHYVLCMYVKRVWSRLLGLGWRAGRRAPRDGLDCAKALHSHIVSCTS